MMVIAGGLLLTGGAGSSEAQQLRRYVGPMPGSTPQFYQRPMYRMPQFYMRPKTPQGIIGTYGARRYIGGKVMQYAPRAGRFIKGNPWGTAGSILLWPDVAY
jgi:hypothetical protein